MAAYIQRNDYYRRHNLEGAECVFSLVQQRGGEEDGERGGGIRGVKKDDICGSAALILILFFRFFNDLS